MTEEIKVGDTINYRWRFRNNTQTGVVKKVTRHGWLVTRKYGDIWGSNYHRETFWVSKRRILRKL